MSAKWVKRLVFGMRSAGKSTVESYEESSSKIIEKAHNVVEDGPEIAAKAYEKGKEMSRKIKAQAEIVGNDLTERSRTLITEATEAGDKVIEKGKDLSGRIGDNAEKIMNEVLDKVIDVADNVADYTRELLDKNKKDENIN